MFVSFILFTIPTVFLNYLIINNIEKISMIAFMVLYYLYLSCTIFLILAGTSDPGIFERNLR
jgi:hypothetical protein